MFIVYLKMSENLNNSGEIVSKYKYFCSCGDCPAIFTKRKKLNTHLLKHSGKRPFKCNEPNCEKTYTNSSHLNRHKLSHKEKNDVPQIKCPVEGCKQLLANSFSLKKHCARAHNPNRYVCETCSEGFHKKNQLKKHLYSHAEGTPPSKCEICKLTFPTKGECNRHKRTHTRYTCKCQLVFERWSSLLKHRKDCEATKVNCGTCKKVFNSNYNLKQHQIVHEEDRLVYECSYNGCPKYYFYKNNLQYHINKYHLKLTPPKKYVCTYGECKKAFSQKNHLSNHVSKMHVNGPKSKRKPTKPRKDTGSMKRSMAIKLSGLVVPLSFEKAIVDGKDVNVILEYENDDNMSQTEENTDANTQSV